MLHLLEVKMSVTFFFPGVPEQETRPFADEPDYIVMEPIAPFQSLNFANSNIVDLMKIVEPNLEFEMCGTWTVAKCEALLERMRFLRYSGIRALFIKQPTVSHGHMQPTIYECGRNQDYVNRRMRELEEMLLIAVRNNKEICYG